MSRNGIVGASRYKVIQNNILHNIQISAKVITDAKTGGSDMRYEDVSVGQKVSWKSAGGSLEMKGEITNKEEGECYIIWQDGTGNWYKHSLCEMSVENKVVDKSDYKFFAATPVHCCPCGIVRNICDYHKF